MLFSLVLTAYISPSLSHTVHGFSHTMYNVIEGSRLNVTFQGEVKGTTQFDGVPLPLRGTIMSEAVTAGAVLSSS